MRQILLLVVFVLAARWLVKTMRAAQTQAAMRGAARPGATRGGAGAGPQAATKPRQLAEPMVRCAVCGVHAPKSESVFGGAHYFCSVEHARRYAARANGREGR
ncbi:PP0621 family protein [Trinickia sp. Y13]|uniref:PP0621 family protein n=1 Tax=Trinickia sp. Y13 TaxID=2917807 RepID=UPI0024064DF2|nr:PP0621 family protein [Trinickia sp. Y13]MDG0025311.1 deaminase [Trinickia sp. Y13]